MALISAFICLISSRKSFFNEVATSLTRLTSSRTEDISDFNTANCSSIWLKSGAV